MFWKWKVWIWQMCKSSGKWDGCICTIILWNAPEIIILLSTQYFIKERNLNLFTLLGFLVLFQLTSASDLHGYNHRTKKKGVEIRIYLFFLQFGLGRLFLLSMYTSTYSSALKCLSGKKIRRVQDFSLRRFRTSFFPFSITCFKTVT